MGLPNRSEQRHIKKYSKHIRRFIDVIRSNNLEDMKDCAPLISLDTRVELILENSSKELQEDMLHINFPFERSNLGSALHVAAASGFSNIVKLLIAHGRNIDEQNAVFGNTPLHLAACNGFIECVKILVESGANMYLNNHYGHYPNPCTTAIRRYLHVDIPHRTKRCRDAIVTLLLCRRSGPFNLVDKHNVHQICQLLWKSRRFDVWD